MNRDRKEWNMWQVCLLTPPYSTLIYDTPPHLPKEALKPGQRVVVPLGRSTRIGVLTKHEKSLPEDFPKNAALKSLLWPLDMKPLLNEECLGLARNLARRQMAPLGRILETFLPKALCGIRFSFQVFDPRFPRKITPTALKSLSQDELKDLWDLMLQGRMRVRAARAFARDREFCSLTKDPPWPVRPGAKRQLKVLEYLWDQGRTAKPALLKILGAQTAPALRTLIAKDLVRLGPPPEEDIPETPMRGPESGSRSLTLTPEQESTFAALLAALEDTKAQTHLVFGVTGSGKTLIYLRLAEQILEKGRSVFLLAPEVALARRLYQAASLFFPGRKVHLFHGYQPPAAREEIFSALAASNKPELVVGTRSALFLPLKNIGLMVLDEEHDASFKQEEGLVYQAKEVAFFRSRRSNALLVLGSATPDVKTFFAAGKGDIGLSTLKNRVYGASLPKVGLVDLRSLPPDKGPFAPETAKALARTIAAGNQAIIMLNRRGYAPLMYCLDCGVVAKCVNCDVGLTYHKDRERLVCHYCGLSLPFPRTCASCGGGTYLPLGKGTQHIEESLAHILPLDTKILRLDKDSARREGRMEEILDKFAGGEAQVLAGTQMLSKGHHFPDVTLVVAADGDIGLNLPDYRAAERTFQLLVQVSGRAGRGDKPGEVLIQTRNPGHYCWQFVRENDYAGFFEREKRLREKYSYPPFVKLGLVRMNYPLDYEDGRAKVMELARVLGRMSGKYGVRALGPAPSPLSLLRGRKRYQCLLKAKAWPHIRSLYAEIKNTLAPYPKIRTSLDLDPVNML